MADFSHEHAAARHGRDAWQMDNDRGLTLAADGDWTEATEAFASAADSLARSLPSATDSHEALALVLSNLAQANYRMGRVEEAVHHSQRVCALRVALAGEDAMPVARAHMDLAVMLAATGRLDEARMLVQRAISAIEHRVGEEDARLAIVLENAARIALAAGNPANAEPLLLRLHSLLDVHELSTERAERLLARVADVRARQEAAAIREQVPTAVEAAPMIAAVVDTPVQVSAFEDEETVRVYAHASIEAHEEWEDQPLRDAVAVTDVLLRTTPSGVPIIPAAPIVEPPGLDDPDTTASDMLDTMDLTDVLPAPSLREATVDDLLSLDVHTTPLSTQLVASLDRNLTPLEPFDAVADSDIGLDMLDVSPAADALSGLSLDLADTAPTSSAPVNDTDFDLDLTFDDDPPQAAVRTPSESSANRSSADYPTPANNIGLLLDFAVEHGVVNADDEVMLKGPPISSPIPDGLPEHPTTPPVPVVQPGPMHIVSSGSTSGIAPLSDIEATTPPVEPPAAHTRTESAELRSVSAPAPSTTRRATEARATPEPASAAGNSKLYLIIGGVVIAVGGAAAFFLLK